MADAMCSECGKPAVARSLCRSHYNQRKYRLIRYGEPLPPVRPRSRNTCTVVEYGEVCGSLVRGHGMCSKHHDRWRTHGDPLISKLHRLPMEKRFWAWVDARGPDECWPWKGFVSKRGYGQFCINRHASMQAHKMAYTLVIGRVPTSLQLDHMCHDPEVCRLGDKCPHRRCCNPAHLKPATNRANTLRGSGPTAVNAAKTHCDYGHETDHGHDAANDRSNLHAPPPV